MQSVQCCTYCRDRIYMVSPMMRHDRKFNKRRKGLGSLARSPFSFWNALIVQYFCLPHLRTSESSHIALIIAAFQQALAMCPTFLVCTLCCPSPLLFLDGGLSTLCRDVLGLFPEKTKLKKCSYPGACIRWCLQQPTAALPMLPLTRLQQTLVSTTA